MSPVNNVSFANFNKSSLLNDTPSGVRSINNIVDLPDAFKEIPHEANQAFTELSEKLSSMNNEQQLSAIQDLLTTAKNTVTNSLTNNRDLTSGDLVSLNQTRNLLDMLSNNTNTIYGKDSQPQSVASSLAPLPSEQAAASTPESASGNGNVLIFDSPSLAWSFGSMNGPTVCYIVMLWMMTGPLTKVMNNYSTQVSQLGQDGDVINQTLSDFLTPIATWAAQNNQQLSPAGSAGINLFDSFYAWLQNTDPNSPYLGEGVQPTELDGQFAASNGVNSVFQTMYGTIKILNDKLNTMFGTQGQVYVNIADLTKNGDNQIYTPNTQITQDNFNNFPQQLFMSILTQKPNAAGYSINGLTSDPIFTNAWYSASTTDPIATWDASGFNTASSSSTSLFYNIGSTTEPKYSFFLTLNNINTVIGNNNQNSGSTGNGAISVCLKTQTTVGTTNAMLTGTLNLYSTTYSNYTSTLQNILPTLSIKG